MPVFVMVLRSQRVSSYLETDTKNCSGGDVVVNAVRETCV